MRNGWILGVALLLAGCSTPAADETTADAPTVVTDPRDLLNGTAPGSHIHDYWDGRDQVQVLDADSGGGSAYYAGDHGIVAGFQPPEGNIVPQGTGIIEATLDWTPSEDPVIDPTGTSGSQFTRVELWVKTAADSESSFVAVAQKGVPFRFNSTNPQDDPPHYSVSLWSFEVMLWNEGGSGTSFAGTWHLEAMAFRSLPLVVFPPHPDPWQGEIEKALHEESGHAEQTGLLLTYGCTNGCLPWFTLADGVTVPFDAQTVTLRFQPAPGATPVPVGLEAHGADSRQLRAFPGQDQGGATLFVIDLEPGMGDSPYALQSLWEFRIHPATPMEQGTWIGDYTVSVKASR